MILTRARQCVHDWTGDFDFSFPPENQRCGWENAENEGDCRARYRCVACGSTEWFFVRERWNDSKIFMNPETGALMVMPSLMKTRQNMRKLGCERPSACESDHQMSLDTATRMENCRNCYAVSMFASLMEATIVANNPRDVECWDACVELARQQVAEHGR